MYIEASFVRGPLQVSRQVPMRHCVYRRLSAIRTARALPVRPLCCRLPTAVSSSTLRSASLAIQRHSSASSRIPERVKTHQNASKRVKTRHDNRHGLFGARQNASKRVKTRQNASKRVKTRQNASCAFQTRQNASKRVKTRLCRQSV